MKPKINPKKLTEALFSVSDENQCLEEVRSSLAFISKLVNSDSHFRMFIQSKKISGSQKAATLNTILAEAGHPLVNETISYLKGSDAVSHLKYISVLFNSIYKKRKNILSVKATIAQKMSENEIKSLTSSIESILGKNTELSLDIDSSIIGGLKLRIDNTFLDASIKNKLKGLRTELLKI